MKKIQEAVVGVLGMLLIVVMWLGGVSLMIFVVVTLLRWMGVLQ